MAPKQNRGASKQDYGTPANLLSAIKRRLGISVFAIDVAASDENHVAPAWITEAENALVQAWPIGAGWIWCNPPYKHIKPWVGRAAGIGKHTPIAMLLPAGVGSDWWREYVHGKALVLFLNGRPTFVGCTDAYPKDLVLLLYGPYVSPGYDVWNWRKDVVEEAR